MDRRLPDGSHRQYWRASLVTRSEGEEIMSDSKSVMSRRLMRGSLSTTAVFIALGVAIGVNVLASRLFVRADWTQGGVYTLSQASRDAMTRAEAPIRVKVFLSPDLPPPLHTLPERITDTLNEYQAASSGKLTFELISPRDGDTAAEEAAASLGCEKVAIGQQSRDQVSLRAIYKCVVFQSGDKAEVIRDLYVTGEPSLDNFEYDFTKALLNLSATQRRKIAFAAGLGGPARDAGFAQSAAPVFKELYGELVEPISIDLSSETISIPQEVTALILLDPSERASERALFAIDQFVQRGGAVGWYQSSTAPDEVALQQLAAKLGPTDRAPDIRRVSDTGLQDLFAHYGVEHRRDTLLDRERGQSSMVLTSKGVVQINNPGVFQVGFMDRALPFLKESPPVSLPTPSSLVLTAKAQDNRSLQVYEALRTAPSASRYASPLTARTYEALMEASGSVEQGEFLVAVALSGELPSYYEDRPLPPGVEEEARYAGERKAARVFVVGSGEFFVVNKGLGYDEQLAGIGQQLLFGSMDWLAQDNALSQIRDKRMPRLIGEVSPETKRMIQFINIVFVPSCFAMIGLVMMVRRRKRRERLGEIVV